MMQKVERISPGVQNVVVALRCKIIQIEFFDKK